MQKKRTRLYSPLGASITSLPKAWIIEPAKEIPYFGKRCSKVASQYQSPFTIYGSLERRFHSASLLYRSECEIRNVLLISQSALKATKNSAGLTSKRFSLPSMRSKPVRAVKLSSSLYHSFSQNSPVTPLIQELIRAISPWRNV